METFYEKKLNIICLIVAGVSVILTLLWDSLKISNTLEWMEEIIIVFGVASLFFLFFLNFLIPVWSKTIYLNGAKIKVLKIFFIVSFFVLLFILVIVFFSMRNSEPVKYSLSLIESNSNLTNFLGSDYKVSWFVGGSVKTVGSETKAEYKYKIKGNNGTSIVYIDCEKRNNKWSYNKMIFYYFEGKAESIDLLE